MLIRESNFIYIFVPKTLLLYFFICLVELVPPYIEVSVLFSVPYFPEVVYM